MARSPKRLFDAQQLGNSAGTLYTCPANTKCVLRKLSFVNPTGTAETVTVYLIKSGGSAGDSNTIVSEHSIGAGETYSVPDIEGHVMDAGDFIQALAGSASTITAHGSGTEVT